MTRKGTIPATRSHVIRECLLQQEGQCDPQDADKVKLLASARLRWQALGEQPRDITSKIVGAVICHLQKILGKPLDWAKIRHFQQTNRKRPHEANGAPPQQLPAPIQAPSRTPAIHFSLLTVRLARELLRLHPLPEAIALLEELSR
jgi:hypothetical protein